MLLRCIMRSMWIFGCDGVGVMVVRRLHALGRGIVLGKSDAGWEHGAEAERGRRDRENSLFLPRRGMTCNGPSDGFRGISRPNRAAAPSSLPVPPVQPFIYNTAHTPCPEDNGQTPAAGTRVA